MHELALLREGLDGCMCCRGGAHNPQDLSKITSFIRVFILGRWGFPGYILDFRVFVRV